MRRILPFLLAVIMMITAIPLVQAAPKFSDVPRDHWAYEEITTMAEKGIIQGYDGKFRPNSHITRAEFAKIMIAAAGVDISKNWVDQTFSDVPRDHWAFYYVEYAKPYLTGYKSGSRYTYKPNEDAVREDIAVALVRLLGYDRKYKPDMSVIDKFHDDNKISTNLRAYIAIAVQTDLIKGYNGYFRPQDSITRAEAASLLFRALLEKHGDDETKVVFPAPDQPTPTPTPTPELPTSVSDSFSATDLKNWSVDKAIAHWGVVDKAATAITTDNDIDHFFLPLRWKEDEKPSNYEIKVDVIAKGTNGLGGLYFNGKDGKAYVVFVGKDKVTVGQVTDAKKEEINVIATSSYKLRATNQLKVIVKDDSYYVYVNGSFIFGQDNQKLDGTSLGLYLQRAATKEVPGKMTYLDNFSFKVVK